MIVQASPTDLYRLEPYRCSWSNDSTFNVPAVDVVSTTCYTSSCHNHAIVRLTVAADGSWLPGRKDKTALVT